MESKLSCALLSGHTLLALSLPLNISTACFGSVILVPKFRDGLTSYLWDLLQICYSPVPQPEEGWEREANLRGVDRLVQVDMSYGALWAVVSLPKRTLKWQNHKGWKKPTKITSSTTNLPPPCPPSYVLQCHIHIHKTSRDNDSTSSLGSLCHCLTALCEKEFFLIFNLKFSLGEQEKGECEAAFLHKVQKSLLWKIYRCDLCGFQTRVH